MELKSALTGLSALGHETRLRAFRQLVQAGQEGLSVGALRDALALPAATLTAHLNILRAACLVVDSREGRFIRVRADYARMNELIAFLTENCCAGSEACAPFNACEAPSKETMK